MTDLNDVGSEYEALVRQATGHGLQGLDCTLVQLPNDQNGHHGVVLAAVTTERGVFRAVGEAWRDLLPPARRGETLTTAEIRAKARALREALGMPPPSTADQPAVAGSVVNGATSVKSESVPDRTPVPAARPTEVGSTSVQSSLASTNGAPTPLGGSDARAHQAAKGGPLVKSAMPSGPTTAEVEPVAEEPHSPEPHQSAKFSPMPVDGLGTDMVKQLLKMTKQKAAREGNPAGDDEALQRLDSYFQRAFGHSLAEASNIEGKRVIQRLAADLSRTGPGQG